MVFQRITVGSEVFGGKPCIRGLHFPVSRLLGLLAACETPGSILQPHPYLEEEDIHAHETSLDRAADREVLAVARHTRLPLHQKDRQGS